MLKLALQWQVWTITTLNSAFNSVSFEAKLSYISHHLLHTSCFASFDAAWLQLPGFTLHHRISVFYFHLNIYLEIKFVATLMLLVTRFAMLLVAIAECLAKRVNSLTVLNTSFSASCCCWMLHFKFSFLFSLSLSLFYPARSLYCILLSYLSQRFSFCFCEGLVNFVSFWPW